VKSHGLVPLPRFRSRRSVSSTANRIPRSIVSEEKMRKSMAMAASRKVPTIACINRASVDLGVDFDELIVAQQKFLDKCFVPYGGHRQNS
jgi:hypothetical protein